MLSRARAPAQDGRQLTAVMCKYSGGSLSVAMDLSGYHRPFGSTLAPVSARIYRPTNSASQLDLRLKSLANVEIRRLGRQLLLLTCMSHQDKRSALCLVVRERV